ncbi:MAG TPA: aminotransferase class I/II-fold pyridoxal phosphate-dependent enzyme [Nannocystaceae bacterium]|nr:aminotransferase class I/II-fold pyridoxal phosphate-dependent enzyme [Nannocystaceae bacterium]
MSWRDRLPLALAHVEVPTPFDYASRPDLVRLDCNELPVAPGPGELREYAAQLAALPLHRYPEIDARSLREAFARRHEVAPEQVLVGNGSIELIGILLTALGSGAGMLYPDPSFAYYDTIARTHGAERLAMPLDADFELDVRDTETLIDLRRPALAIFASPNNPTGKPFDPATLLRLARKLDGIFVVDEAYADYAGTTLVPQIEHVPGLFVLRTLSKLGYAGLRIGALIGPRDAIRELDKVRLPWNVNAISVALGCSVLAHPERLDAHVGAVVGWRRVLEAELAAIPGVRVIPSAASFLLVRVPFDAHVVFAGMLRRGVLVKDVSRPGIMRDCLRISVGTGHENERCVAALRDTLRELG